MSGTMYGADIAQLRQLAQRFDQAAEQLAGSTRQLTGQIQQAQAWQGPDAARFRGTWSSTSTPQVQRVIAALHEAARSLRANADDQEGASAADGGAVLGPLTGTWAGTPSRSEPLRPFPGGIFSITDPKFDAGNIRLAWAGFASTAVGNLGSSVDVADVFLGDVKAVAKVLGPLGKVIGPANIVASGFDLGKAIDEQDWVSAGASAIGGMVGGVTTAATFAPAAMASVGVTAVAVTGLATVGLGVVALKGLIDVGLPYTPEKVDSTYAKGVEYAVGPHADPNNLTPAQAAAVAKRYSGILGPVTMISDTMDATADKIFPWNKKK